MIFSMYETILIFLFICILILLIVYSVKCTVNKNIQESFATQCDVEAQALENCQKGSINIDDPVINNNTSNYDDPNINDDIFINVDDKNTHKSNIYYRITSLQTFHENVRTNVKLVNDLVKNELNFMNDTYKFSLYNYTNIMNDFDVIDPNNNNSNFLNMFKNNATNILNDYDLRLVDGLETQLEGYEDVITNIDEKFHDPEKRLYLV